LTTGLALVKLQLNSTSTEKLLDYLVKLIAPVVEVASMTKPVSLQNLPWYSTFPDPSMVMHIPEYAPPF
jgi:hypothetical protein